MANGMLDKTDVQRNIELAQNHLLLLSTSARCLAFAASLDSVCSVKKEHDGDDLQWQGR